MITPSHLIYSWALGTKLRLSENGIRVRWFVLGGFLPDVPIYVFFIIHGMLLGTNGAEMWNELYFNSAWTPAFTLAHSFILWPLLYFLGIYLKRQWLAWLSLSAILHTIIDFLVHHDDAYQHFWPLSSWRFKSPLSYWDPAHFGVVVGMVDAVIILFLLGWLFTTTNTLTQYKKSTRWIILGLGIAYSTIVFFSSMQLLF